MEFYNDNDKLKINTFYNIKNNINIAEKYEINNNYKTLEYLYDYNQYTYKTINNLLDNGFYIRLNIDKRIYKYFINNIIINDNYRNQILELNLYEIDYYRFVKLCFLNNYSFINLNEIKIYNERAPCGCGELKNIRKIIKNNEYDKNGFKLQEKHLEYYKLVSIKSNQLFGPYNKPRKLTEEEKKELEERRRLGMSRNGNLIKKQFLTIQLNKIKCK
jgi:hypothetical protein